MKITTTLIYTHIFVELLYFLVFLYIFNKIVWGVRWGGFPVRVRQLLGQAWGCF